MDQDLDLEVIKKRTVKGIFTLVFRTGLIQVFSLVATFILTILLDPKVFGIFFIVSAAINFLVYFSDIGLAAALIQKREKPTQEELSTTFFVQQALVIPIVLLSFLGAGLISRFYRLDESGLFLYFSFLISFFLSSLKTIPTIILERNLQFTKLATVQILENFVFYTLAVILASLGFGINSFTVAVLARGFLGFMAIYLVSSWIPSFIFKKDSLKKLLSFGFSFQGSSILALIKDDLLTLFLGKILPFSQVGYVGWAQKWAFFPLRFILDNVNKVAFPTYSRLVDQKEALKKAIEKSIFAVCFFTFPSLAIFNILAPYLIEFVPRYQKWELALPSLYFFSLNAAISCVSTTLTNTLWAKGKAGLNFKLMVFWTTLTWILTPFLVFKIGFLGVALASFLVSLTSIGAIYLVKKVVEVEVITPLSLPFLGALLSSLILIFLASNFATSLFMVFILALFGGIIYLLSTFILSRGKIIAQAKEVINILRS